VETVFDNFLQESSMSRSHNRLSILLAITLSALTVVLLLSTLRQTATAVSPPLDYRLINAYPNLTFRRLTDITNAGDRRLFVVEKAGAIRIAAAPDATFAPFFLDIEERVISDGFEQGLLGLAFHPHYAENGYFYVNYTHDTGDGVVSRVSRFQVTANPNFADPDSEQILLQFEQPGSNHNGGALHFGPDGYLYIATGDGGSAGDPWNNAQDTAVLLGKLLRIDVDGNGQPPDCDPDGAYTIPADNPLSDGPDGACDEIWAYGLRNPWRFSFDSATGDLYIGDVGQGFWEEIDRQPAGVGGLNYGWRCYEGTHEFKMGDCANSGYTFPIFEYIHTETRCSITGGYVYRGQDIPSLLGTYIFADFCSGEVMTLTQDEENEWQMTVLADGVDISLTTFGQDINGEIYLPQGDSLYRLVDDAIPELVIKKDAPTVIAAAQPFNYTITVRNEGALVANQLVISDTLPAAVTYLDSSDGGTWDGDAVSWTASTLYADAAISRTITVSATAATVINDSYGVRAANHNFVTGPPAISFIDPEQVYLPLALR
jgi:uncharacterized repeat protein (TIGR01451 family)